MPFTLPLSRLAIRIARLCREACQIPARMISWGGWPMYLCIVVSIMLGLKVLATMVWLIVVTVSPPPTIPPKSPDYSLKYVRDSIHPRAPIIPLTEQTQQRVRNELLKTSTYCATLSGEQQLWCEHMIGHELLSYYNAYRDGRAEYCEQAGTPYWWNETTNFQLKYYVLDEDAYYDYNPSPDAPNYDVTWPTFSGAVRGPWNAELGEHGLPYVDHQWGTYDHGKTMQSCKFPAIPKQRGHWYVNRVGPFSKRDKGSWHFIWFHAFAQWNREFALPNAIGRSMTASLAAYTDAQSNIIGYPPLHMHHFHVFQVNPLAPFWPHTVFTDFETHGDDMCSHLGLGPICYMKVFPPGYGSQIVPRYFVDSLANFVADNHPEDDETFWVDVSILVTDDRHLKLERIVPFVPMMPGLHGTMPALAGTYTVPKKTDSLVWCTLEVPYGVEILWWKWHTHYYYTNEVWFVEGDGHDIFGLDDDPYRLHTVPFTRDDVSDGRRDPTGDPMEEFDGDIEKYAEARFPVPSEWEFSLTERYLDLATTPLRNMEGAKADLVRRHRAYNAKQLETGGKTADFLFRLGDIERFHAKVGDRLWTYRPFTKPSKSVFAKGDKITIIAYIQCPKRNQCRRCEESKQPIRQHIISVMTCRPLDGDMRFAISPFGTRLIYFTKYFPASCAFFVVVTLAVFGYIIYAACSAGKCSPVSGPCSHASYKTYTKLAQDELDDDEEDGALQITSANGHRGR